MMALTKCFVILFLVYLNFDISPLDSAAIPETLDLPHSPELPHLPDSINENDDNSEIYTTTGATEEDIEKIFETYENLYIKNSNWYTDDEQTTNANNEKLSEVEEETTVHVPETTEHTADDVVESIHNIMDETIDTKKNRTDRTIVVVVTTNVFNINGSDDSSKRQHTLLSFGTPGMIPKETSTDATLAMHNKITSAFFNSNPSPVASPDTQETNDNESAAKDSNTIVLDDHVGDSENIPHVTEVDSESIPHVTDVNRNLDSHVTEAEDVSDANTTNQPRSEDIGDNDEEIKFDIRRFEEPASIQSLILSKKGDNIRSFDDEPTNDDSNDILKIMKIIPSRSVDESSTGSLSKPFEIPVQEQQDSSLMEAMENILDTDVRKAFERDIPQTHHVPLDINIEEEALYAPLKDLSEYIIEEVPINVEEIGRKLIENAERIEKVEKSSDHHVNHIPDRYPITESDNLTDGPLTEIGQKTTTDEPATAYTTEEATPTAKITDDKETREIAAEAELSEETTETVLTKNEGTTSTTDGPVSNADQEHIERVSEKEESPIPTTTTQVQDEKLNVEDPAQVETSKNSNLLDEYALSEHDEHTISEPIVESVSDIQETPEPLLNREDESTSTTAGPHNTFVPESSVSLEADNQMHHTTDDSGNTVVGTFEKLVDPSFDEYPIYVHLDTTTEYVTNPNLYIGALFSGDQVAAILEEAERARTSSYVQIFPSIADIVDFSTEENSVNTPSSFIDTIPSQGDVRAVFNSEDNVDKAEDTQFEADNKSNEADDKLDEVKDRPDETVNKPDEADDKSNEADNKPDEVEDRPDETVNRPDEVDDKSDEADDKPDEVDDESEDDENKNLQMSQARNFLDEGDSAKTLVTFLETRIKDLLTSTTEPHGEDVVSEVVKVDEETTELHQIIKKPGVDDATNGTIIELKTNNITNVESNHLASAEITNLEIRSFGDSDDPVDPLRTLVEAVELTADITKTVDNFQSFIGPNDSIHLAANQIIEDTVDMELVKSADELKIVEASSVWLSAAAYIYIVGGVLSIVLIALLGVVSYLRFRQFKRNLLFSC